MTNTKKGFGIAAAALLLFAGAILVSQPASAEGVCWGNTGGETCAAALRGKCLVYLDSDAGGTHDNCVYLEQQQ